MRASISKRWLLVVPLLLLLAYCLTAGFSMMMADIYHKHVNYYFDYWAKGYKERQDHFSIPAHEMNIALASARKAREKQPDDPVQLLQLATVYQWRPLLEAEGINPFGSLTAELDLIRQAVSLRPAWPYSWMALAGAKARYGQIDDEFNKALVQAVTLGPWEADIMEKAGKLGKYYHSWLSPEAKIALQLNWDNFRRAYPGKARKIERDLGKKKASEAV
ncbi:hypothetical protein [Endozoicomonas sp. Mp262]|uniref:hypothetical protein n=1 Tax=Endozoicomonas sp. Mp262 TaxID=2919499 RepID=UPI0021DB680C